MTAKIVPASSQIPQENPREFIGQPQIAVRSGNGRSGRNYHLVIDFAFKIELSADDSNGFASFGGIIISLRTR